MRKMRECKTHASTCEAEEKEEHEIYLDMVALHGYLQTGG
jgi:hypothetical protein